MIEHIPNDVRTTIEAELSGLIACLPSRREKSLKTAEVLFFRHGIYPSSATVRAFTKQGSTTDIGRDLAEFWESIRLRGRAVLDLPQLPESVAKLFTEAMGAGWQHLAKAAEDLFQEERRALDEKIAAADQATSQAQAALQRTQTALGSVREDLAARAQEAARLGQDLTQAREALAAAQAAAAEHRSAFDTIRAQLDAALETERQERIRIEQMSAREVAFAKEQIDSARTDARRARNEHAKTAEALRISQEGRLSDAKLIAGLQAQVAQLTKTATRSGTAARGTAKQKKRRTLKRSAAATQ